MPKQQDGGQQKTNNYGNELRKITGKHMYESPKFLRAKRHLKKQLPHSLKGAL